MSVGRIKADYAAIHETAAGHGSAAEECYEATQDCLAFIRGMSDEGSWKQACDEAENLWNNEIMKVAGAEKDNQNAHNNGAAGLSEADHVAARGFPV